jgi:hypothetical protein
MFYIMQILPAEAGFDVRLEQLLGTRHSVQDGCQVGFNHKSVPHSISISVADPICLSRLPDLNFFHPGTRIRIFAIPDPHQRI